MVAGLPEEPTTLKTPEHAILTPLATLKTPFGPIFNLPLAPIVLADNKRAVFPFKSNNPLKVVAPEIVVIPLRSSLSEEDALTVRAPGIFRAAVPEITTPPAPEIVRRPEPVKARLSDIQFIAEVAVTVVAVAIVALVTLKVPAVYVIPPLNIQFAEFRADKSKVPAVNVTRPVKVEAAPLLLSVKLPVPLIEVVPVTLNAPEVEIKSGPLNTDKFWGTLIFPVPPRVVPPAPVKVIVPAPVKAMF
jgi:hypothetical protein